MTKILQKMRRLRWRAQRVSRRFATAWRYATGRSTPDDGYDLLHAPMKPARDLKPGDSPAALWWRSQPRLSPRKSRSYRRAWTVLGVLAALEVLIGVLAP